MSMKLNAAGLEPESSMLLPPRHPATPDEGHILDALRLIYTQGTAAGPSAWDIFSPDVSLTLPNGELAVGLQAVKAKLEKVHSTRQNVSAKLQLLEGPPALPPLSIVVDVLLTMAPSSEITGAENNIIITSAGGKGTKSSQNLVVLKRRSQDGKVTAISEEEGHRRPIAPLIARTAAASNFTSRSPTDNLVSPCTSKLNLSKKKHFTKAKPTTLFGGAAPGGFAPKPSFGSRTSSLGSSKMAQSIDANEGDVSME